MTDEVATVATPGPARFGTTRLTVAGERALAAAKVERVDSPVRWSSVDAAVRAWVRMRDEGASLRSTSDPDRANRVQTSTDPSLGGREHDAVEKTATVGRALIAATRHYPLDLSEACPVLEPEQCRSVYLLSVCGKARHDPILWGRGKRKQHYWHRVSQSVEMVAEEATSEYGVDVEGRHVIAIQRHFFGVILAALVASGEMRAPRGPEPRRGSFAAGPRVRGTSGR